MNSGTRVPRSQFKDEVLFEISPAANVAQFVSFAPDLKKRFHRIRNVAAENESRELGWWIDQLLATAPEHMANIRTFRPGTTTASEFITRLFRIQDIVAELGRLADAGLYTIVNEHIDMSNGGTAGVAIGDLLEFVPCDTPRGVESPGTFSISRKRGMRMLELVYQHSIPLNYENQRIEFTTHPMRCGYSNDHTVIWEAAFTDEIPPVGPPVWPNRFSRLIGDKAFGLLLCSVSDLLVPRTLVISRRLPPFSFGEKTDSGEKWLRPCSTEPMPGRFTTVYGWKDPFALLESEDPNGSLISSVLAQDGVLAAYSGSSLPDAQGELIIEGVKGTGTAFLLGQKAPEALPEQVIDSVRRLYHEASEKIGSLSFEWVNDGTRTWIVQAHINRIGTGGIL